MSVTTSTYENFVGGEWVGAVEGETMEVLNPATGETIAEVPRGTQADVDRAVEAAKKALPEWLETTPAERAEILLKLADLIDENAEELAQLESREHRQADRRLARRAAGHVRQHPLLRRRGAHPRRAARAASTCAATRRGSAASRSGSSAGSRRGTTR